MSSHLTPTPSSLVRFSTRVLVRRSLTVSTLSHQESSTGYGPPQPGEGGSELHSSDLPREHHGSVGGGRPWVVPSFLPDPSTRPLGTEVFGGGRTGLRKPRTSVPRLLPRRYLSQADVVLRHFGRVVSTLHLPRSFLKGHPDRTIVETPDPSFPSGGGKGGRRVGRTTGEKRGRGWRKRG